MSAVGGVRFMGIAGETSVRPQGTLHLLGRMGIAGQVVPDPQSRALPGLLPAQETQNLPPHPFPGPRAVGDRAVSVARCGSIQPRAYHCIFRVSQTLGDCPAP